MWSLIRGCGLKRGRPDMDAASQIDLAPPSTWRRMLDSDLLYSFRRSKVTVAAGIVTVLIMLGALLAPWIAPHDPFDLRQLSLMNSHLPPAWMAEGQREFLLGTDDQGRDVLSTILHGSRSSLGVGFLSVAFAASLGILLGLIAGYAGGALDGLIMRIADIQLTFPAILIALLIDGSVRALAGEGYNDRLAFWVLVFSIGLSFWVQYARTVRGSTMVEKNKEYVLAARLIGIRPAMILARHILPNVTGPVLVIATINLALAIILEATLSFLGVGLPPTQPSLGTLIRIGNNFLFSGEWWIAIFPGMVLALLVLAVNLVGDWLRDALNPKLR
ncbi:MAG: peptide/nickel transport system permease protein [Variibacter sp.]|jgi:peptide/nickel transport system permease protein|nr:peptide/nickel transport system permease protein [Variibacter sp.]